MNEIENKQREKVVQIAKTFIGTPYHHMGRVKGSGVDCLTLLAEVYKEAGLIPHINLDFYPKDWHLHRDEEKYFNGLLEYTKEVEIPLPGDIVLFKFGRCFSHSAIVVDWPLVIHAHITRNTCYENIDQAKWLTHIGENGPELGKLRARKYFSFWNK